MWAIPSFLEVESVMAWEVYYGLSEGAGPDSLPDGTYVHDDGDFAFRVGEGDSVIPLKFARSQDAERAKKSLEEAGFPTYRHIVEGKIKAGPTFRIMCRDLAW